MTPGMIIGMIIAMVVGYIVMKLLATKYFVGLYRKTGKNMITRPRQLLGFIAGFSLFLGLIAVTDSEIRGEYVLETMLMLVVVPLAATLLMLLANKSVGGKDMVLCTVYQLALGVCFVGRFLVWLVELMFEISGMLFFGETAHFTWHPFFFTIINRDGTVIEKKKANVVMNEDGSYEGSFKTAANIEREMNDTRIAQEQRSVTEQLDREKEELAQALQDGHSGAREQQKIDELEKEYQHLETQKQKR